MKKRNKRAALRCMEQPAHEIFRPLAEQQQQAASLPIKPNGGDAHPATVAVATAIKPTETPGSLVEALLQAKPTDDDHKVVVFVEFASPVLPRVVMVPATVADGVLLSEETFVATITRDDATKPTSSHSIAVEAGQEADALAVAVAADLAASKPKRGVAALVNSVFDNIPLDPTTKLPASNFAIVFDQTGDGSVKLYKTAEVGDVSAKVADVATEAAPVGVTAPSLW